MQQTKEFKWSEDTYSMREFVDVFSHRLPLVIDVVEGRICDEIIGAQTFRISAVRRQRRIITRHSSGYYVAIPTRIKQKVDIFFPDGRENRSATMRDVAEALHANIKGSVSMMFKDDRRFLFSYRNGERTELSFGKMNVIDVYEERFLVGHSVFEGKMTDPDEPFPIAIYADADVAPAVGLVGGTKEDFRKVLADMSDQMANIDIRLRDEIVLLPKDMTESDYERVTPIAIRSKTTGSKTTGSRGTERRSYSVGTTSSPVSSDRDKSLFDDVFTPAKSEDSDLSLFGGVITPEKSEDSDHSSYEDAFTPVKTTADKCRKKKTRRRRKSNRPRPLSPLLSDPQSPITGTEIGLTTTRADAVLHSAVSSTDTHNDTLKQVARSADMPGVNATCKISRHARRSTVPSPLPQRQDLHDDVPSDIRSLHPEQLATCLLMLKIPEHCVNAFLDVNVDGELLMSIDESILMDEFKFSKFDALKLMKFAARGHSSAGP